MNIIRRLRAKKILSKLADINKVILNALSNHRLIEQSLQSFHKFPSVNKQMKLFTDFTKEDKSMNRRTNFSREEK
jgi:hypothetical protein